MDCMRCLLTKHGTINYVFVKSLSQNQLIPVHAYIHTSVQLST